MHALVKTKNISQPDEYSISKPNSAPVDLFLLSRRGVAQKAAWSDLKLLMSHSFRQTIGEIELETDF